MEFSVIMSVYSMDSPVHLNIALESIWDNQTLKPNQIILVEDGPLTKSLYEIIAHWKGKLNSLLHIISLKKNSGLGNALNSGLKDCKYDYVARMDADDISEDDRFQLQHDFLINNPNIDVVGGFMYEFGYRNGLVKYPIKYSSYSFTKGCFDKSVVCVKI